MTLKTIIDGHVTSVFLNTDHFGLTVTHKPDTSSASVSALFTEDAEVEGVRRARLQTASATTTITDGDYWKIDGEWWRTMHTDIDDHGMQLSVLHLRLPSLVTIKGPSWSKRAVGSEEDSLATTHQNIRAKFVLQEGAFDLEGQRRKLDKLYTVYLEETLALSDDHTTTDETTGIEYRILGYEKPEEFDRLFRLFCEPL